MTPNAVPRPPAWDVLERALIGRHAVRARYHGHHRVMCPHVLGWKDGRATVLVYQCGGTTSSGTLPTKARQRWRTMFVDEIDDPVITDNLWESADNYAPRSSRVDHLAVWVAP